MWLHLHVFITQNLNELTEAPNDLVIHSCQTISKCGYDLVCTGCSINSLTPGRFEWNFK